MRRRGDSAILVEDGDAEHPTLAALLEPGRFTVTPANRGLACYPPLANRDFTIAVIALALPDQAGKIPEKDTGQRTASGIVVVTGQDQVEAAIDTLWAGADLVCSKPVDLRELPAVVGHGLLRKLATPTIRPPECSVVAAPGNPACFAPPTDLRRRPPGPAETTHTGLRGSIYRAMRRRSSLRPAVLVLSRIDADRVKLMLEPIDPGAFAEAVGAEVKAGNRAAGRFEFHAKGLPGPFVTAPNRLHQSLSPGLGGAARYSPAGTTPCHVVGGGSRRRAGDGGGRGHRDSRGRSCPDFRTPRAGFHRRQHPTHRTRTQQRAGHDGETRSTTVYEAVPTGGSRIILILPSGTPSSS